MLTPTSLLSRSSRVTAVVTIRVGRDQRLFAAWAGSYFVPRATVGPQSSLRVQIWPGLDRWIAAHKNPGSAEAVSLGGIEPYMAAGAFLELLE